MTNYILEEKDSFIVLGIGTELQSDYTDYAGINKEKADFWEAVKQDGRLDALKAIAANDYIFAVNEAVNNKMMYYAGVMTEESVPEATRVIQFPKGEYLIVKGRGSRLMSWVNCLPVSLLVKYCRKPTISPMSAGRMPWWIWDSETVKY